MVQSSCMEIYPPPQIAEFKIMHAVPPHELQSISWSTNEKVQLKKKHRRNSQAVGTISNLCSQYSVFFFLAPSNAFHPPPPWYHVGVTAAESPDTISCFVRISLLQDRNISVLCL